MSFTTTQFLPYPREHVWQWHTRQGSAARLTPPFLPMAPIRQAKSLADGTTVFAFPAGLKWVARHDITEYRTGRVFVDECVSAPVRSIAQWRHTHIFDDAPGGTQLTDVVDTRVPTAALRAAFAYRQRQLELDLAAIQRIRPTPRTIAITGSRGLIGRALTAFLRTMGVNVIQLVRSAPKENQRLWDPHDPAPDLLDGIDSLVHLAGEPIGARFTPTHKAQLRASRVAPTRKLAELVNASPSCDSLISASAIGYYGTCRGAEHPVTTDEEPGTGFLAELCRDWETAAGECTKRTVVIRTGFVLSGRGGLLPIYKALFSAGLGGPMSTGEQWMSWIALDDLTDAYATAIFSEQSGAINAVAPEPVRNREFSEELAAILRRPAVINVPSIGPKILLGREGATELALADQRIASSLNQVRFPRLTDCLSHEFGVTDA